MRIHFGFEDETETPEEVKIVEKESAMEDPLGDPLAEAENDPLNTSSPPEGEKESGNCDIIEIKDVEAGAMPAEEEEMVEDMPVDWSIVACSVIFGLGLGQY